MLKKPYIINLLCAAVLIAVGLYSYFTNENKPPTALIAPGFGLLLILTTPGMKKENKIIAHIVVLLTLIFGVNALVMGINSADVADGTVRSRRYLVFGIMAGACFLATFLYVLGFIEKKKAKKLAE